MRSTTALMIIEDCCVLPLRIRETCFPNQMTVDDRIRPCCVTNVSKEVIAAQDH